MLEPGAWVEEAGERIARLTEARLVSAPASTLSWSRIRRLETSGPRIIPYPVCGVMITLWNNISRDICCKLLCCGIIPLNNFSEDKIKIKKCRKCFLCGSCCPLSVSVLTFPSKLTSTLHPQHLWTRLDNKICPHFLVKTFEHYFRCHHSWPQDNWTSS